MTGSGFCIFAQMGDFTIASPDNKITEWHLMHQSTNLIHYSMHKKLKYQAKDIYKEI